MRKLPPLTARRPPRALGFTLTELLVVVTVLAILVALLLPVLGRARYLARATCCISNHRQVLIGLTTYAADYGGAYPARYPAPAGGLHASFWSEWNTGAWDLHRVAEAYLGAPATLFCPASYHSPPSSPWQPFFFPQSGVTYYDSTMEIWAGFYAENASASMTVALTEFPKRVTQAQAHRPLTGDMVHDQSLGNWDELWLAPHHWRTEYQRYGGFAATTGDWRPARGPCLPTDLNNPYGYPDGSVQTSNRYETYATVWFGAFYWAAPPKP